MTVGRLTVAPRDGPRVEAKHALDDSLEIPWHRDFTLEATERAAIGQLVVHQRDAERRVHVGGATGQAHGAACRARLDHLQAVPASEGLNLGQVSRVGAVRRGELLPTEVTLRLAQARIEGWQRLTWPV